MALTVQNRQRKVPFPRRALLPRLRAALAAAEVGDADVCLVLVSDAGIRRLNRDWRHVDAATDVLAFPAHEGVGGQYADEELGDVVVSLERAREQGPIHVPDAPPERAFEDEVVFLFVHGLLHLVGHDHHDPAGARRMRAAQQRVLAKCG